MDNENNLEWLQPQLFNRFKKNLQHGQLAHAYLFEGVPGVGKKEMAIWLSQAIFCLEPEDGLPCGKCQNCTRILEHQHPDVTELAPDGLSIKVDQVRELKTEFSKSGVEGRQKVFIVEDVEKMTVGAANSLLKFLEEPEGTVVAFLLTTAKQKILPTILSRCQLVHFSPLSKRMLLTELKKLEISEKQGALLVHLTNSLESAVEMNRNEWFNEARDIIWKWFQLISQNEKQAFIFVQTDVMPHFKEREQQMLAFELLLLAYRDALMLLYGSVDQLAYPQHQKMLQDFLARSRGKDITAAIETILFSRKKLESNVSAQGVFEQMVLLLMRNSI
ncbi:DNA polymerase III subunit delta' [Carnobacterium maltaromaticum]|uniref:DNA polymerase III subunit delta' n=1 Tax=Carnobacterium maltaromaticum TaxID=2751 RepID=UPI000C78A007|nr:DNA polymerase III subunit delta' [Carnobacterium maltaromaticum]PLS34405.1 DNA polymerase III subunit delta' [Carnobacterium maltaromaticum]PLS34910.1 DNA polymerase III subunit delta' [Carnobacterium maltaromaticum]PLS35323.1 DNA polymerase III subunit delta' [Carnobacterium maltaromaticum]PLS41877.1 DNA polymerase III subunit delta' [Carnobacterium maltaromaticum]PLS44712.1 DNA polymerase III subunit delta' [Carnobacterium maltaromaticum]